MTSKLKCPFCKEETISDVCCMFSKKSKDYTNGRQIYKCNKCGWFGNKELWQELIRTRKAVDLAIRGLEKVHRANSCITKESQIAYEYLKEIKQLIKEE